MIRSFEVEKTKDGITLLIDPADFNFEISTNFYAIVMYDNPTPTKEDLFYGSPNPDLDFEPTEIDYYAWLVPFTNGTGKITNENLYPKQLKQYAIDDYRNLLAINLYIINKAEFSILTHLQARLDMVHRRYPEVFNKKFTLEELLLFLEATLLELNLTPPITRFWFNFDNDPSFTQGISNALNTIAGTMTIHNPEQMFGGIPAWWIPILTEGAMIQALLAQGILEVDINFQLNDGSISISYDNASGISGWYDKLVSRYEEDKKKAKMFYIFKGIGLGTVPYAAGWLPLMISNASYADVSGYPWFMFAGGLGRAF